MASDFFLHQKNWEKMRKNPHRFKKIACILQEIHKPLTIPYRGTKTPGPRGGGCLRSRSCRGRGPRHRHTVENLGGGGRAVGRDSFPSKGGEKEKCPPPVPTTQLWKIKCNNRCFQFKQREKNGVFEQRVKFIIHSLTVVCQKKPQSTL